MAPEPPSVPRRRRLRSWLPRALFESSLIVFSVLFALLLNEWRAGVAQRGRIDQALGAIRSELQENHRLVNEAREYHLRLAEGFTASQQAGDETPDFSMMGQGLVAPAHVLRTAWESAQDADLLARVPYETVLKLSSVYARQGEYESLSRGLSHAAYEQILQHGFDAVLRQYDRFILVQRDFAGREAVLGDFYEEALAALP
jgi:hypothetical protein